MKNLVLSVLLTLLTFSSAFAGEKVKESTYDRVMRTGTIRCGYVLRPPMMSKDLTTGALSGVGYDLIEDAANRLSLKVDWAEEDGFGTIVESIKSGRVDMGCGIFWANAARSVHIAFTNPIYFETAYVYKRSDDKRTFTTFEEMNDPRYSFSSIDGGTLTLIKKKHFPQATEKTLPELSPLSDTLEDMRTGKVDFVIQPQITAIDYLRARPGSILPVIDRPIAYYPTVMFLPAKEIQLRTMIDQAFQEIGFDGTLESILDSHGIKPYVLRNPRPIPYETKAP